MLTKRCLAVTVTGVVSSRRKAWLTGAIVIVALAVQASVALGEVRYTITDLGTLPGWRYSKAYSINNAGQVVGYCWDAGLGGGQEHAFLYANGAMQDLLPGYQPDGGIWRPNRAMAINDAGQIVGALDPGTGIGNRAILMSGGQLTSLGTLPGMSYSNARNINSAGQVIGYSYGTDINAGRSFIYDGGQLHDLGVLPGRDYSLAYAINSIGTVVGYSGGNSAGATAFVYSNGMMQSLEGVLGAGTSTARGINDAGDITGNCSQGGYLYSAGTVYNLGAFSPSAINQAGQIVGVGEGANQGHAFIYSGGGLVDLNSLISPTSGWTLEEAYDINDHGQIVGWGSAPAGDFTPAGNRAFLLTPVPEPATMGLLALGCAGLAVARIRRRPGRVEHNADSCFTRRKRNLKKRGTACGN